MKSDFWEDNGQIFVHYGRRYGVTPTLRTICIDPVEFPEALEKDVPPPQVKPEPMIKIQQVCLPIPLQVVTDKSSNPQCLICGSPIMGKRNDRRYCSARCRQKACRRKELISVSVAGEARNGC